jgi:hypothetical protein
MPNMRHKSGFTITGLDDGGVTLLIPEHTAHHKHPGYFEVSFSAKTLKRMKRLGKETLRAHCP